MRYVAVKKILINKRIIFIDMSTYLYLYTHIYTSMHLYKAIVLSDQRRKHENISQNRHSDGRPPFPILLDRKPPSKEEICKHEQSL